LRAVTPGPTAQPLLLRENEVIQWGPRSSARSPEVGNTKSRRALFFFHICESAVDLDVPISDILRCSMYAHGYGCRDMALSLFNRLPTGARDNVFKADYSKAEKSCPQKIEIGRVLKRVCEDLG
jgi:hypothetical protein